MHRSVGNFANILSVNKNYIYLVQFKRKLREKYIIIQTVIELLWTFIYKFMRQKKTSKIFSLKIIQQIKCNFFFKIQTCNKYSKHVTNITKM